MEGETVTVFWPSTNGRVYAVDKNTDLAGEWQEEVDEVLATGEETSYKVTLPLLPDGPVPERLFVRVRDVTNLQ